MFELIAVAEPIDGSCGRLAGIVDIDDDAWVFDEARWDALLADVPPFEASPVAPPSEPGFADCVPSGWLALELDTGTGIPLPCPMPR
jgi:hypothetical protein